jgi:hypothetical protein
MVGAHYIPKSRGRGFTAELNYAAKRFLKRYRIIIIMATTMTDWRSVGRREASNINRLLVGFKGKINKQYSLEGKHKD